MRILGIIAVIAAFYLVSAAEAAIVGTAASHEVEALFSQIEAAMDEALPGDDWGRRP